MAKAQIMVLLKRDMHLYAQILFLQQLFSWGGFEAEANVLCHCPKIKVTQT